jgi:hypothetical protein
LKETLEKLDVYLAEVEAQDRRDDQAHGAEADAESLPQKLRRLQTRRAKLQRALKKLQADPQREAAEGKSRIRQEVIPTDPDAVWVKKQGRIIAGYNCHAAVDDTCGMVVAVKADACAEEREQLNPMVAQVEKTAGVAAATAVADNGYYSDAAIVEAEEGPSRCLVPDGPAAQALNRGQAPQPASDYHCDHFRYDAVADRFTCPQGRALEAVKKHRRRGQPTTVYRGGDCASCPVREQCTTDRQGARTIEVHRPYEPIRRAKERLRSEEGQALYKKRKSTIEAVFGQWQHNRGVRRLRLRGLSGCDIELHLLAIGHNVKKFWKQGVKFSVN